MTMDQKQVSESTIRCDVTHLLIHLAQWHSVMISLCIKRRRINHSVVYNVKWYGDFKGLIRKDAERRDNPCFKVRTHHIITNKSNQKPQ
jgi:hypothetical protein